ncbi:MAG: response regulator [Candidatus Omnitrophica bacterium]|nr:response regulator [Candidatus Omnitrophota bacterium]
MEKSVLVADDEPGFKDMYAYLFQPFGIAVDYAANGEEALERVKRKAYDLVFLDVHMPKLDGPGAFRGIRQARPEQKVVVFSSNSDPDRVLENQMIREGALDCLYKPVSLDDLRKILSKAFGSPVL